MGLSIIRINWILITDYDSLSIETIFSRLDYLGLLLGLLFLIGVFYYYKRRFFFRRWKNFLTILDNEINNLDIIEVITTKNLKIRTIVSEIQMLKFLDKIFFVRYMYSNTLNAILLTLIEYLLDLRSDLATRIIEQQSALESAKTEVENTITGTPELLAVSEAQQVRLERQIEQFEELQRVLVRV
jgi:hypothetical protein